MQSRKAKRRATTKQTLIEAEALGLLGLARRAGALTLGVDVTRRAMASGDIRLVVVAADASGVQLAKLWKVVERFGVEARRVSSRDQLGRALGAGPLSAVGVKEKSFATRLSTRLPQVVPGGTESGPSRE